MGQVYRRGAVASEKWGRGFWADWGERTGSTFLEALATLIVMDNILEKHDWDTTLWPILVVPTLLAAIKGLLANMKDQSTGASLLPGPPGPVIDDHGISSVLSSMGVALFLLAVAIVVSTILSPFVSNM